jgi:hypothetical protein
VSVSADRAERTEDQQGLGIAATDMPVGQRKLGSARRFGERIHAQILTTNEGRWDSKGTFTPS